MKNAKIKILFYFYFFQIFYSKTVRLFWIFKFSSSKSTWELWFKISEICRNRRCWSRESFRSMLKQWDILSFWINHSSLEFCWRVTFPLWKFSYSRVVSFFAWHSWSKSSIVKWFKNNLCLGFRWLKFLSFFFFFWCSTEINDIFSRSNHINWVIKGAKLQSLCLLGPWLLLNFRLVIFDFFF